jgi:hypothetical protein
MWFIKKKENNAPIENEEKIAKLLYIYYYDNHFKDYPKNRVIANLARINRTFAIEVNTAEIVELYFSPCFHKALYDDYGILMEKEYNGYFLNTLAYKLIKKYYGKGA